MREPESKMADAVFKMQKKTTNSLQIKLHVHVHVHVFQIPEEPRNLASPTRPLGVHSTMPFFCLMQRMIECFNVYEVSLFNG